MVASTQPVLELQEGVLRQSVKGFITFQHWRLTIHQLFLKTIPQFTGSSVTKISLSNVNYGLWSVLVPNQLFDFGQSNSPRSCYHLWVVVPGLLGDHTTAHHTGSS